MASARFQFKVKLGASESLGSPPLRAQVPAERPGKASEYQVDSSYSDGFEEKLPHLLGINDCPKGDS